MPLLAKSELEGTGTHGQHGFNWNTTVGPGNEPVQGHQRKVKEEVLAKVFEDPRGNPKSVSRKTVDQHDGRDVGPSIILCLLLQHGRGRMDCFNRWWCVVIGHGHGGVDGCFIIHIHSCTNALLLVVLEEGSGTWCIGWICISQPAEERLDCRINLRPWDLDFCLDGDRLLHRRGCSGLHRMGHGCSGCSRGSRPERLQSGNVGNGARGHSWGKDVGAP